MTRNVKITTEGIKYALSKLNYTQKNIYKSISEYIWNGFDARASEIIIEYDYQAGLLRSLSTKDNGYGIAHKDLSFKFDPFFESEKLIDGKVDRHSSAFHGRNGVGRLTFCTFANFAKWVTTFEEDRKRFAYEINISANELAKYTGQENIPKETKNQTGTAVTLYLFSSLAEVCC